MAAAACCAVAVAARCTEASSLARWAEAGPVHFIQFPFSTQKKFPTKILFRKYIKKVEQFLKMKIFFFSGKETFMNFIKENNKVHEFSWQKEKFM